MERESHYEGKSLEMRYFELVERIENGTATNLKALDELLVVGAEYYREKASDGNELHEELGRIGLSYIVAKNGSYHKEKATFCLGSAQAYKEMATNYARQGMYKEAQDSRLRAESWLKMKSLCVQGFRKD